MRTWRLALLMLAFIVGVRPATAGHLAIEVSDWVGYGPLFLARDMGNFKANGLDVDLQMNSGASDLEMGAVLAGQAAGAVTSVDYVVKYGGPGICFKIVDALDDSYGGDGLLTPSDVTDIHQLKGKTVALSEGTTSQYWLDYMLHKAGMDYDDVNIVNMAPDDAASAFIADRVPFAMTWEPHLTFVRESGHGKVLLDSRNAPGVIVDVIVIRCDVIEQDRKDVQALVDGVLKADDYIKSNPAEAAAIMKKYVGGFLPSDAQFAVALNGVRFYDRAKNLEYIGTKAQPGPLADIIDFADDVWGRVPAYADAVKVNHYDTMVDPGFVAQ